MLVETAKMLEDKNQRVPRPEDFIDKALVRFFDQHGSEVQVEGVVVSWED